MKKKIAIPTGDQLFIKVDVKSPWEPARLSDLNALLTERETPYSAEKKLKLPQFGYGRKVGETSNQQIYPTRTIVFELDTPSPDKGELHKEELFEKYSNIFKSIFNKILSDKSIPFKIMYLTPSMCGLRFVLKLKMPVNHEDEYKAAVSAYAKTLEKHGVIKEYLDIKVNCGWFIPTYKTYYARGSGLFSFTPATSNIFSSLRVFRKVVDQTLRSNDFEEGNRNNFIYALACNAIRYGIDKESFLANLNDTDYVYDQKEVFTTVNSAYNKNKNDFGIWKNRANEEEATVSIRSLIRRAKHSEPIPLIWSGIKEGAMGFVFGPAKTGKSTFCECLAFSIASGLLDFISLPIKTKQKKVLYISMEEHWQMRVERNKLQEKYLFETYNKKVGNNFYTNNEQYPRYILDDSDLKFIEIEINKFEPNIVFIDSLTHLIIDKVEDSTRTNRMMSRLRLICDRTGATFIIIHHTIKKKDKPLSIMDMAGSRVLAQEADFMIGINQAPNGQRYLKEVSFRQKAEDDKIIPFNINENRWIIAANPVYESELFEKKDGRRDDTNKIAILNFIQSVDGPVTTSDIKDHFNNEISTKTIHNNLNKLQEEGKIERVEKGLYKCSADNSNK